MWQLVESFEIDEDARHAKKIRRDVYLYGEFYFTEA